MEKIPALFKVLKYGSSLDKMGIKSAAESSRLLATALLESLIESLDKVEDLEKVLEFKKIIYNLPEFRATDGYAVLSPEDKSVVDNLYKLLSALIVNGPEGSEFPEESFTEDILKWYVSEGKDYQGSTLASMFLERFYVK